MKRFCLLVCIVLALLSLTVYAEAPQTMFYQGRLTDATNNPVPNGSYDLQFVIWDSAAGFSGIAHWVETHTVATTDGLFSVLLGTSFPLTYSVFQDTTRYLGITVIPGGEVLPRTKLVTVPWAFRVASIDGAQGGLLKGNLGLSDNGVMYWGDYPFIHKSGNNNTFIGSRSGNLFLSGSSNTATGADAMLNIGSGNGNTANGYDALYNTNSGSYNTAIGSYAMLLNQSGAYNTAIGTSSLLSNTNGVHNTAGGYQALYTNSTGDSNTAYGVEALYLNSSGSNNTAVGVHSLYNNTTAGGNTAVGKLAMYSNQSGNANAALGYSALYANVIGGDNTAVGSTALLNSTGSQNTAAGSAALVSNLIGTNNTAMGYFALGINSSGTHNTAIGSQALQGNLFGGNNTAIGAGADVASGNLGNATAIGSGAVVNASNKVRIGNTTVSVIEGQVAYTFTSDRNQKENFRPVDGEEVLNKVRELDISSWNYIGQEPQEHRHYGPVAQDFFAAFGNDGIGTVGSPTTLNSGDMAGIMMIAIQQLGRENDAVRAENAQLRSELDQLKAQVSELVSSLKAQEGTQFGVR